MQVLGELMNLDAKENTIPLPWYHRAALGHESNTTVSVVLVKNNFRKNFDLIVSVIDPKVWDKAYRLSFKKEEGGGVVNEIFKKIHKKWDVILSESVAQEGGNYHLTSIICEPKVEDVDLEILSLKKGMLKNGFEVTAKPVYIDTPHIIKFKKTQVKNGHLTNCGWIFDFLKREISLEDQCKVLVTADTRLRILRFNFCRKNTVSFDIEHIEEQGTLKLITEKLLENPSFNILSSLSSKSGVPDEYARFRIVCEIEGENSQNTIEYVEKQINEISARHPLLSISVINFHLGKKANRLTYCNSPYDIVARVPGYLRPHIIHYKKDFPKNKFPIFISRRFVKNSEIDKVVNRIKKVLTENDCYCVEAFPKSGDRTSEDIEVKSKMWLSKAGILLINSPKKLGNKEPISLNLPQEYGFLDGQGKPILILQEGADLALSEKWSNVRGVKPTFIPDNAEAFNPENENSIDTKIIEWLNSIKFAL